MPDCDPGQGRSAAYLPTFDGITAHLMERFDEGDVVLTMGAGDVWKVADELVARLCPEHNARCAIGA
jgi:UDP-N-acetylmuramate--alanine ligase